MHKRGKVRLGKKERKDFYNTCMYALCGVVEEDGRNQQDV